MEIDMVLKQYTSNNGAWLGWVENARGDCVAFVRTDGSFVFDW
tara:strand:- start:5335 stop:5463 length:129 start_codon:yes stop_codon:yes gene_type:complete